VYVTCSVVRTDGQRIVTGPSMLPRRLRASHRACDSVGTHGVDVPGSGPSRVVPSGASISQA